MNGDLVDILVATYNGERFLKEQLTSLLQQDHPHIHIYIRDDSSTDHTKELINQYVVSFPDKITVIPNHTNLGIKGNFSELLENSNANYVMFSDQDDIWMTNKVRISLEKMKQLEKKFPLGTPLLIHSDLKVVNADLSVKYESFWHYAGLNPKAKKLNQLLVQNNVTGCTMLLNRSLANLCLPIPKETLMHDWWITLVASAFGQIDYVNEATILYRQHATNDTGAKSYSIYRYLFSKSSNCSQKTYVQARVFLERYASRLDKSQKKLIETYALLGSMPYFQQKMHLLKGRFFKQGFLRNSKHLLLRN